MTPTEARYYEACRRHFHDFRAPLRVRVTVAAVNAGDWAVGWLVNGACVVVNRLGLLDRKG